MIPSIEQFTPAVLAGILSSILSLFFRFVPGALAWFDTKDPAYKQLFMLLASLLIATMIGAYNMAATGFSQDSILSLLFTVFASLSGNALTFTYTKRSPEK